MRKPTRTIHYTIVDGFKCRVYTNGRTWKWRPNLMSTAYSDTLEDVREGVKAYGGQLVTEPNPDYAAQMESYVTYRNRRKQPAMLAQLHRLLG